MNTNIDCLRTAGLSEREALAYLDLQQYGESKTGKICERTKIPSSQIYILLNSLLEKGLVNYKVVNNIKVFRASDPDALGNLFDEKEQKINEEKKQLLEFISKLKIKSAKEDRRSDFEYYSGIRGIKSLYTEIINTWKPGDEYIIAAAPQESFAKLEGFFIETIHKKRIKDKVKLRILINKNSEGWGIARKNMPLTQVKFLDINTSTEYGVLNELFFMVNYGTEPYGLLIRDQSFANTYKAFFEILWENASI